MPRSRLVQSQVCPRPPKERIITVAKPRPCPHARGTAIGSTLKTASVCQTSDYTSHPSVPYRSQKSEKHPATSTVDDRFASFETDRRRDDTTLACVWPATPFYSPSSAVQPRSPVLSSSPIKSKHRVWFCCHRRAKESQTKKQSTDDSGFGERLESPNAAHARRCRNLSSLPSYLTRL